MRYRVFWHPDAESDLESIARLESGPEDIAACARRIDRHLARFPKQFGESREENLRIGFERPLSIPFDVFESERTVVVYRVRRI